MSIAAALGLDQVARLHRAQQHHRARHRERQSEHESGQQPPAERSGRGEQPTRALFAVGALVALEALFVQRILVPAFQFTAFVDWDDVLAIIPVRISPG